MAERKSCGKLECVASGKPRREDLSPGENLCQYCPAKCCNYVAVSIETPTTWPEFDTVRWMLLHEKAAVFVEDDVWYLLVYSRCRHLMEDNRCGIYETRPQICRDYTTDRCEYDDDWVYDHFWETPEQIEEYAAAVLGPRPGQGPRTVKPR